MKTIQEIVINKGLACEYGYNLEVVPYADVVKYMKLYAEQAIDAAADKAYLKIERHNKHIMKGNYAYFADDMDHVEVDNQSILKIKEELK